MGYQTINILVHIYILFILCFQGPSTSTAGGRGESGSYMLPVDVSAHPSDDDHEDGVEVRAQISAFMFRN